MRKLAGEGCLGVQAYDRDVRQVVDSRLGKIRCGVGGDDQGGIDVALRQQVHGRELARVEAGEAAAEVDAEGIAGLPGHDVVGPRYVAVAPYRFGDEMGVFIQVCGQGEQGARIEMPAAGHGQAHAEKQYAVAAVFHPVHQFLHGFQADPGLFFDIRIYLAILDQRPQRP